MSGRSRTPIPPGGDPWSAFGYIVAGVAVYGIVGWALGLWLGTRLLIPVGIMVGATLGCYMVFARYGRLPEDTRFVPPTPTDRQPAGDDLAVAPATSRGENA